MRQEGGNPLLFALKFLGHQSENKQMKPFVPEEKKPRTNSSDSSHLITENNSTWKVWQFGRY